MEEDTRTPTQRLADYLVEGGLEKFVRDRRAAGMAWRRIERDLWTATKGEVDVTLESLRNWYPDPPPREDSGAVA